MASRHVRRWVALFIAGGLAVVGAVSVDTTSQAAGAASIRSQAAAADPPIRWLCRPGVVPNPCEIPLDTTNLSFSGKPKVKTPARKISRKRPVDCFYVYPTVSNQVGINTTKAKDPELNSIAEYQAARFSSVCRMYAPVYRQAPLTGIATLPAAVPTAYADVKQAFERYLKRFNRGRGVILIGHSQGTMMLRKLMSEEIDPNPKLRRKLVGAILIGGNVTVAAGKTTGGDFNRIPLCTKKGQFGCVVAYSTYSADPLPVSFFGNTVTDVLSPIIGLRSGLGYQVACTDPAKLSGIKGPVGVTIPSKLFAPGLIRTGIGVTAGGPLPTARTTWVQPPDRAVGACKTVNGGTVYRFSTLPGSRHLNEFPPLWGTHLIDVNLGLERLVKIATLQSRAWRAKR